MVDAVDDYQVRVWTVDIDLAFESLDAVCDLLAGDALPWEPCDHQATTAVPHVGRVRPP